MVTARKRKIGSSTDDTRLSVRTLAQAKAFVLRARICGIFSDAKGTMPCLWVVVDLPERRVGEAGWGEKVTAIWRWKNELPAKYPREIFYGKIKGGLAVLMSVDYLRREHYPRHYRRLEDCSALARRLYEVIRLDPISTGSLREEVGMTDRADRNRFDKALQELQITLNVVRRNSLRDEKDTWVPFSEQHLDVLRAAKPRS